MTDADADDDLRRLFAAAAAAAPPPPAGMSEAARAEHVLARIRALPVQTRLTPWFAAALAASLALGFLSGGAMMRLLSPADDDGGLVLFEGDT